MTAHRVKTNDESSKSERSMMHWYVLYVKPQQEKKVSDGLEKIGLTIFCPMQTEVRQWSDRKKKVQAPLFKSYVFVQLKPDDRNVVFSVSGVVRYLFWLGKPALVRNSEIQTIKKWLSDDEVEDLVLETYVPGDEITIERGALINQKARIERIDKKQLRMILIDIGMVVSARLKDVFD